MKLDYKDVGSFSVKQIDDEYLHIKGYASTFGNIDSYGDIVIPGAFKDSLSREMPKMLLQHNTNDVIGVVDSAYEDEKGLFVEGRLPKSVSKVKDLEPLLKMGALGAFSIGYTTKDSEMTKDGNRLLKNIDLWEVSVVTFPANTQAKITGVKKLDDANDADNKIVDAAKSESINTKREFESMLIATGSFTKKAAIILASRFNEIKRSDSEIKQSDSVAASKILKEIENIKKGFTHV